MKNTKRLMALLLTLVMVFSLVPLGALAAEPLSVPEVNTDNMTVQGTNGFGYLLSDAVALNQEQEAQSESEYGAGYAVTDLEIEGNTATVTYSALEEAVLIVALYSEDGMQMLTSGKTTVTADATEATVTLAGTVPEYFLASAYLVDVYDLAPLCAAYDTPIYTREMQELLASTVDDYDSGRVLNLDENKSTNFAVYADTTKIIPFVAGKNTVASVNGETATYVIENADQQFTSLKAGDVFAYAYGENEILIAKVAAISVAGTTVTITGDEMTMEDAFAYVKIESTGTSSDMTVNESTCGDGVTYLGMTEDMQVGTQAVDGSAEHEHGFRFGINEDILDETSTEYPKSKIHVEGTLDFQLNLEFQYYLSGHRQFVKFLITHKIGVTLNFEGKITAVLDELPEINFTPTKAFFIGFSPEFEFSVSAKVEVSCTFHGESGFIWDGKNARSMEANPRIEGVVFFEGTIFLGIDFNPEIRIISEDFLTFSAETLAGAEVVGKRNVAEHQITTEFYPDTKHECQKCLDVTVSFVAKASVDIELFCATKWTFNLGNLKIKLGNWYFSFDFGDSGEGKCPHLLYKIAATVIDGEGKPVSGAIVNIEQEQAVASGDSPAIFYRKAGQYTVTAKADGLSDSTGVEVTDSARKVVLILSEDEDDDDELGGALGTVEESDVVDESIVADGTLGDGITWILHSNGLLEILGSGTMRSYAEAPWKSRMDEITAVRMDEGILNLTGYAFIGADNLVTADLPESLTSIGGQAFTKSGITSIRIPKAVSSIGASAFMDCESLVSVYIGGTDLTIGNCAFYSCDSLQTVEITGSVVHIGLECFQNSKALTTVKLPETLQSVGKNIFYGCSSLSSVNLPASLTSLGVSMFQGCKALTSITIPDTVTSIGDAAFSGTGLTSVTVPKSVTHIGASAFSDCDSLLSAYVDGTDMTIDNCAFYSCDKLKTVEIVGSATHIGLEGFQNCKELTSVKLPDTVQTVGKNLFYGCSSLTKVNIPASLTSLSNYMFQGCKSLASITIPDTVTSIGNGAFDGTALTTVNIPESVTYIGSSAFYDCESMSSAYIHGTDLVINNYAFSSCSSLANVYIYAENVTINIYAFARLESMQSITFYGNAPTFANYVFYATTVPAAYYPAGNATWTADVLKGHGGTVTWIPFAADANGNLIEDLSAAVTDTTDVTDHIEVLPENAEEEPREEPVSQKMPTVDAVYGGEYGTEVTDTYTRKTASFTGLVPGAEYLLLALKDIKANDPLSATNLLFVDQGRALADGTLKFTYVQRESTEISYVVACGASNKNLQDAQITFPEMTADGEVHAVNPTVIYGGKTLTEGRDYVITGTVSYTNGGTYNCYIQGIRNYTGGVACTYTVKAEPTVKWSTISTSLGGNIAMNFYVELSENLVSDPNAYIQFSFAGRAVKFPLSQGKPSQKNGVTVYQFSCPITSKNMTDEITAQIFNASGAVGASKSMSVDTYCNWVIANYKDQKTINLMKAMLNYGASAQKLFKYRTDDLANASLAASDKVFGAVDASAYKHSVVGTEEGIIAKSMTLLLDSETTVRVYFELTGNKSIDSYTFTVDGVKVQPTFKDGKYYIERPNISAHRLDDMHVFTCGGITVTYGGLSYVNQVMTYYSSGTTFEMASALYAYSKAAEAYIG